MRIFKKSIHLSMSQFEKKSERREVCIKFEQVKEAQKVKEGKTVGNVNRGCWVVSEVRVRTWNLELEVLCA